MQRAEILPSGEQEAALTKASRSGIKDSREVTPLRGVDDDGESSVCSEFYTTGTEGIVGIIPPGCHGLRFYTLSSKKHAV